jgi:glutathione S-transferase
MRKDDALERLAWLNGELAERRFIAGDRFTVADITALVAIDFGRLSNIRIQSAQEHRARWHQEVSARQSAKA